ncbi:MAG: TetR family transcriptional regulator [Acidimicrobiales bacterium]|jgi:AcrR family transcriptional regulator
MVRWEPDSRGRLAQAAMELYGERGFDQTTVADIAERAGLTERTFFRHFSDKREVLFSGAQALQDLLVTTIVGAPVSTTPIDAVTLALEAAGERFNEHRGFSVQRQRIIDGSAELQERELIKLASLAVAMANALRQRGVEDPTAGLTGEVAIAIFKNSFERWISSSEPSDLAQVMRDSLEQLRDVTSST